MTNRNINDRTLERLVLGELDESEAAAILGELERRGEMGRFEALIADNDAFYEKYPPEMLAARVREEARRGARQPREEKVMGNRKVGLGLGAVALASCVVFIAVYTASLGEVPDVVAPTEEVAAPVPPPTPEPPPEPAPAEPKDQVLVRDRDVTYPLPSTVYLGVGQLLSIEATGISRVGISLTKIIDATSSDRLLLIEGKSPGTTMVRFARKRPDGSERQESAVVVVGDALEPSAVRTASEKGPSLLTCADAVPGYSKVARLTVVAGERMATLGSSFFPDATDEQREALTTCVAALVEEWELQADSHGQLSVGTLNFNFGSGAVCEPGEDC